MAGGHLSGANWRASEAARAPPDQDPDHILPDHLILDRLEEIWGWALAQLGVTKAHAPGLDAVLVVPQAMTAREVSAFTSQADLACAAPSPVGGGLRACSHNRVRAAAPFHRATHTCPKLQVRLLAKLLLLVWAFAPSRPTWGPLLLPSPNPQHPQPLTTAGAAAS